MRFHQWSIMTLYYKMRQILSENVTTVLLQQNVITTSTRFFLQNGTVSLQIATVITKIRQFYLKMRLLLKNVSVDGYIRLEMSPTKNKSDATPHELVLHFLVFIF